MCQAGRGVVGISWTGLHGQVVDYPYMTVLDVLASCTYGMHTLSLNRQAVAR